MPAINTLWQQAGLDEPLIEQLQDQVQTRLDEALYWFPIRHHSPHCAYFLRKAILKRRPKQIFIELPYSFSEVLPLLSDPQTKPPVALYSSFNDQHNELGLANINTPSADIMPSLGTWHPLLSYSPEYVAIQLAKEIGAEVILIDLPAYMRPSFTEANPDGDEADESDDITPFLTSHFYQQLVEHGGYQSWNECWDAHFERDAIEPEQFRYQLACFCAAVRATTQLSADTLQREAFMWQHIQQYLKQSDEAMVVCGGLHLFMEQHQNHTTYQDNIGQAYHTLVPYTYERLSEQSGYQAGNRAPYFYQLQWQNLIAEKPTEEALYQSMQYLIHSARQQGESLSAADTLSSSQHALMLCQLRNRMRPILDDILDAIITCCCKGNPDQEGLALQRALDKALIGSKRGHITPLAGQLPLVSHFYQLLARYELNKNRDYGWQCKLDIRTENGRSTSAFLHRLSYLSIPFSEQQFSSDDDNLIFTETWHCEFQVGTEESLIRLSPYGDTIETVILGHINDQLANARQSMQAISHTLLDALKMDLPQVIMKAHSLCQQALQRDQHFISLANSVANLQRCRHQLTRLDHQIPSLEPLLVQCFLRATHSLLLISSTPGENDTAIVQGLLQLTQTYLSDDLPGLDRDLFIEYLQQAADSCQVPFLQGSFWGVLMEIKQRNGQALATHIEQYRYAPSEEVVHCSQFIQGVMTTSQTSILLGAKALIAAIDSLLERVDQTTFDLMLVHLRAGFEHFSRSQRNRLGDAVAQHYGLTEVEELQLDTATPDGLQVFAQLDQQVADIMKQWSCFSSPEN